ncbi:MAG: hypothetical protein KBD24_03060 [Candidatus Pacebacteria bacterium]|nr:hypothetical protein [Candidatus Paceibacterota bacterium]
MKHVHFTKLKHHWHLFTAVLTFVAIFGVVQYVVADIVPHHYAAWGDIAVLPSIPHGTKFSAGNTITFRGSETWKYFNPNTNMHPFDRCSVMFGTIKGTNPRHLNASEKFAEVTGTFTKNSAGDITCSFNQSFPYTAAREGDQLAVVYVSMQYPEPQFTSGVGHVNLGPWGEHINTNDPEPEPIDGICGNGAPLLCESGEYYPEPADTSTETLWTCVGVYGGKNSPTCRAPKPVQPKCGAAARAYATSSTAYGGALCDIGRSIPLTPAFPATGSSVTWQCSNKTASPSSTDRSCTASRYGMCTGATPANAVMYPGDEPANMVANVPKTYSTTNTSALCEYHCSAAYPDWDATNNKCVKNVLQACVGGTEIARQGETKERILTKGSDEKLSIYDDDTPNCAGTDIAKVPSVVTETAPSNVVTLSNSPAPQTTKTVAAVTVGSERIRVAHNSKQINLDYTVTDLPPVPCACNPAKQVPSASMPTGPLCNSGTASGVTSGSGSWTWQCNPAGACNQAIGCTASIICGGTLPANTTLCSGDGGNLSGATNYTYAGACTPATKCEYTCPSPYVWNPATNTCASPAPVNGQCGVTTDACAQGTLTKNPPYDTIEFEQWQCLGTNGGTNSPTCQYSIGIPR